MKHKFFLILSQILIIGILLVGVAMLWASLQTFDDLSILFGKLTPDGNLESFTLSVYELLKLPLLLLGVGLIAFAGILLLRWHKTRQWLQYLPDRVTHFLRTLRIDTVDFLKDVCNVHQRLSKSEVIFLLGLMAVAASVRLARLDVTLTHDEAYMYNAFASRPVSHLVSNYHLPNNHVFLSLVLHFTMLLTGNHIWALRMPTILVGVLTVPATYWLARQFYSRETGLLGAALVAVHPTLVAYSSFARGYILIILFTVLTLSLGDYVRLRENRFAWLLMIVFSTLGLFSIPIMLFSFGGLYIWMFLSWIFNDINGYENKWNFLKYWVISGFATAFLTVLLYLPIILNNSDRFFGNGFISPLPWSVFPETTLNKFINTWAEWTESIPAWIIFLAVLGFFLSIILHTRISKPKVSLLLSYILWIAVLLLIRRPNMLPRFWLFILIPLLIWVSAGLIESLKILPLRVSTKVNPVQVFLSVALGATFLYGAYFIPSVSSAWHDKDGMEQVTLYLKDHLQEGDLITATPARLPALRYYFNYWEIPKGYIRQAGKFQRAFIILDEKKAGSLGTVAPQLGFGLPAIDLDTAQIIFEFENFTVYECYPAK